MQKNTIETAAKVAKKALTVFFFFNFRRNRMRFEVNTFWLCFKANKKLWFDDEKKK